MMFNHPTASALPAGTAGARGGRRQEGVQAAARATGDCHRQWNRRERGRSQSELNKASAEKSTKPGGFWLGHLRWH
jgi:hypothetical protein